MIDDVLRPSGFTAAKVLLANCLIYMVADLGTGLKEEEEANSG